MPNHRYVAPAIRSLGVSLGLAAFIGAVLPASHADARGFFAQNACYEVVGEDGQFIRYVATMQGYLTTFREYREFGHPVQATYTVHGKFVPPEGQIGVFDGTVLVVKGTGAAFAVVSSQLGGDVFFESDCTSEEASATPEEWSCETLRVEADDTVAAEADSTLLRVDPFAPENSGCSKSQIFPLD